MSLRKKLTRHRYSKHRYCRHIYPALPVVCISLLAVLAFPLDTPALAYYQTSVQQGEVWRLFTAHFLHTNLTHLAMNLAALWIAFLLHKQYYAPKEYLSVFSITALGCLGMLSIFSPQIPHYVGLSGVLHGLLLYYGVKEALNKLMLGWLLAVGVIAKVSYEQYKGPSTELASAIQANVIIDGHLYGAISGAVAFMGMHMISTVKLGTVNK